MNKTVTLSVDEKLVQQAQQRAASENTTLDKLFEAWLTDYLNESSSDQYQALMARLSHVQAGQHFSREEMNERH